MRATVSSSTVKPAAGRIAAVCLLAALLAACTAKAPGLSVSTALPVRAGTEARVPDFQRVDCDRIWDVEENKASQNALYWLRAIDCAGRLSPAEARAESRRWPANNWQSAFRQGVLLANGNVTPMERRKFMQRLDSFSRDYPLPVRPLIQLWREDQLGQLQLSAERTRYYQLQQSSDAQLDALRQQLMAQGRELSITRRKLETLTDIERQLSSRRSADAADSGHAEKNDGQQNAGEATSTTTTEDATQP